MIKDLQNLPHETADWFTKPFTRFIKIEAVAGVLLLIVTVAALALANSPWSGSFLQFWEMSIGLHVGPWDFSRSLQHWINDGLMTFFFFVVALELKREIVLGELRHRRIAALPFAGALGGMIVPASVYVLLMNDQPGAHGWGTVMATDTAFVIGCLALFGSRIHSSLRLFLLSLAIFDDVGAIVIVAVGYGEDMIWLAVAIGMIGLVIVAAAARLGVRSIPVYFLLGGAIWLCVDASGIHATITGVILGLMTPTGAWVSDDRLRVILGRVLSNPRGEHRKGNVQERHDLKRAGIAVSEALSPVERLEMVLHPWVAFAIMPAFAFANAGVTISGVDMGQPVSVAIFSGLVVGKPVGVLVFSWLAVQLGAATQPSGLSWPFITAGALLTGIGFTMSLFIADLAYARDILDAAKIGILLASAVSGTAGILLLFLLTFPARST